MCIIVGDASIELPVPHCSSVSKDRLKDVYGWIVYLVFLSRLNPVGRSNRPDHLYFKSANQNY